MERLFAAYRVTSSRVALAALVAGNLVPLAGVLFLGWDLMTILILYWMENGIVGAFNVLKMLTARGNGAAVGGLVGRSAMTAFFALHYGIFWAVHGVFVWTFLPMFAGSNGLLRGGLSGGLPLGGFPVGGDPVFDSIVSAGPEPGALALGAIALVLSHGASFLFNYLGRGEYLRTTPAAQMAAPYGRVVILHLTILAGAFVGFALGSPMGALIVLVALKMAMDVAFHLREHRSA